MAAQVEEVVLGADFRKSQHLGEQAAEHLFLWCARAASAAEGDGGFGVGQGADVELAVGVHGQAVDGDEGRRDHVVGQFAAQVVPQSPYQRARLAGGGGGVVGVGVCAAAGLEQAAGQAEFGGLQEDGVVRALLRGPGGEHLVSGRRAEFVEVLGVDAGLGGAAVGDAGEAECLRPVTARAFTGHPGRGPTAGQELADCLGRRPVAAQEFADGVAGGPVDGRDVVEADLRFVGVEDDVVAVAGQFVVVVGALGAQVDAVAEGGEVVGVDEEFLLQAQTAFHRAFQVRFGGAPGALDLGVEGAGEAQVADVADEQGAAGESSSIAPCRTVVRWSMLGKYWMTELMTIVSK